MALTLQLGAPTVTTGDAAGIFNVSIPVTFLDVSTEVGTVHVQAAVNVNRADAKTLFRDLLKARILEEKAKMTKLLLVRKALETLIADIQAVL